MAGGHPYRDAPPPSFRRLLAVLTAACLVPVGAAALTDLATGDRVDTSDRAGGSGPRVAVAPGGVGHPGVLSTPDGDSATGPGGTSESNPATTAAPATTTPTTTSSPTTDVPTSGRPAPPSPADQVLALVNAARADASPECDPLHADDRLVVAAQGHSDDMAERDYFSHTSPEGDTFQDRAEAAGYDRPGGENIAWGYRSAAAVMEAWMDSPGHAANITRCSFTTIGIGVNPDGWYWAQVFGY
ncbi:MAG: CAP domain-containing protein [Acidimicrobiales bacterium]